MFAPKPACVQLTILGDTEPEPEEEFFVCIESLSPLITATGDCAAVHIIDDDSKNMHSILHGSECTFLYHLWFVSIQYH